MMDLPVAASLDFLTATSFWVSVLTIAGIYGIFTLGLQLNVGYTGVLNFGQAGFMALGAYSSVILVVDLDVPFLLALPLAIVFTMFVSLLIGLSSLRLRSDYFAIATIAFSEVIRYVAQNARGLTGGNQGTISLELDNDKFFVDPFYLEADPWVTDNLLSPLGLDGPDWQGLPLFLIVWITLLVLTFGLRSLIRTPWGRVLRAVREDEDAARALGKNAFSYKLQSLAIAAGLGALSGWFITLQLESVSQETFQPLFTFIGYAILVLGGLASFPGVIAGSIIMWTLLEGMRFAELPLSDDKIAALRFIFVGLVLILLVVFRPQGVFGKREEMVLGE